MSVVEATDVGRSAAAPAPFAKSFTQQEAISDAAIAAATRVLRSGRLHRYNTIGDALSEAAQLEEAFARYQGSAFCLACTSGGYAMQIALRAAGVRRGERVLTNAFTLAPVPGAIAAVGAKPVFVETTPDLVIDLEDLAAKADQSGARFLMVSHMRGHLVDMERLVDLCAQREIVLLEDCAHTMGARWDGRLSGTFGLAGCFSTQTYKHINSGEGGLLTSDDAAFMARAIVMSGSYMLYERHGAAPEPSVFRDIRLETPNMSGRMDNVRAAILIPQLANLETNVERWNARYAVLAETLVDVDGLTVPARSERERYVASSFQFLVPGIGAARARQVVQEAAALGVELKWFGDPNPVGFTSNHHSWRFVAKQSLKRSDAVLAGLFDMRIPLTFSLDDMAHIAEIIAWVVRGQSADAHAKSG